MSNNTDVVFSYNSNGSKKPANDRVVAFDKVAYRLEVSRLASLANKRVKRLEKNGLTDSPAYQRLVQEGNPRFGVKGKTFNEVQTELSRLNRFINSQTSTVRGITSNLKDMAKNTGIKYKNVKELKTKAGKFFELASKVEQYLRTVEDMASAIGYNQIWEVINEYTDEAKIDLGDAETDIDSLVETVSKILASSDQPFFEDLDMRNNWVFIV